MTTSTTITNTNICTRCLLTQNDQEPPTTSSTHWMTTPQFTSPSQPHTREQCTRCKVPQMSTTLTHHCTRRERTVSHLEQCTRCNVPQVTKLVPVTNTVSIGSLSLLPLCNRCRPHRPITALEESARSLTEPTNAPAARFPTEPTIAPAARFD